MSSAFAFQSRAPDAPSQRHDAVDRQLARIQIGYPRLRQNCNRGVWIAPRGLRAEPAAT